MKIKLFCVALSGLMVGTAMLASSAKADTNGEGGEKPTCIVMGGYSGHCTNNGKVAEGVIFGCQTDFSGEKHFATIGASFHLGAIRMLVHAPFHDKHTFWNESKNFHSIEWNDGERLDNPGIQFSIIREPGATSTWIQRAWIRCCACDGLKLSPKEHTLDLAATAQRRYALIR